jgi:UDP-N-acetylmuramyl pentapeptide phosphotransferase/UDP-N-acetylglucosamine-1-phosphate transferase
VWGFGNNENGQLSLASRSVAYDPAKIYAGDVGSLALGAEHSVMALRCGNGLADYLLLFCLFLLVVVFRALFVSFLVTVVSSRVVLRSCFSQAILSKSLLLHR